MQELTPTASFTPAARAWSVEKILNVFCQHGASTSILADAHPHIGTDKLPKVIENMRNTIIACGGEVHFQTKMVALETDGNEVVGVKAVSSYEGGQQEKTSKVLLFLPQDTRHAMFISTVKKLISKWKRRELRWCAFGAPF